MSNSKKRRHMERDGYHAVEWSEPGLAIPLLWQTFPELVVEKHLVNTSYDSGFLTLSIAEQEEGWRTVGNLAHSPRIQSVNQIPHDQFDEWLVFDHPVQVQKFETMVNYYGFTPINFWEEKVERFWEQVKSLNPLHVLGENDLAYLVSRDDDLVRRVLESEVL